MIELRWAVKDGTTTEPPRLQYRICVAIDASGAFCPGPAGQWMNVPRALLDKAEGTGAKEGAP